MAAGHIRRAVAWSRETFLRPRSTTTLHIPAPTREQLTALASVMVDMSNTRSSPQAEALIGLANLPSERQP